MMSMGFFKKNMLIVIVFMTTAIFLVDMLTPQWYDAWALYLLPLFFMYQTSQRPYLYSMLVALLVAAGLLLPHSDSLHLMRDAVNRVTAIFGGWGVSVLLMQIKRLQVAQSQANDELEKRIEDRTAELTRVNGSLQKKNEKLIQTEKALRDSEGRFRALIENSPLAISISIAGVTAYTNKKYWEMFGFQNNEELRGRPIIEQWAPQDREMVAERARLRGLGMDVPIEYDGIGQRKDGSQFPMHVAVGLVELAEGRASIAFLTDITERRIAEEALRKSEIKYRNIFENTRDVFYLTDLSGNILDISPSVARYSGYTREELIGKSTENFYYNPQDRAVFLDKMKRTGEVADYEVRMKTKDDRLVIISVSAHFLRNAAGIPNGIEGSLRDITERKRVEENVHKYSQNLEQLLAISRQMTSTTGLRKLYRFAVVASKELLNLDFSTLMLLSDDKTGLTIEDTIGFPESLVGQFSLVQGQGLSTYVIQNEKPDIVLDFTRENRFAVPGIVIKNNIHSAICVPMMVEDEVFGVLIGHTLEKREFSHEDIVLYQGIGNQTAVALKNALHVDALRKSGEKLHDMTSHMAEGIYALDRQGRLTFMNPEAERLLGWTETELLGRKLDEMIYYKKNDDTPPPPEGYIVMRPMKTGMVCRDDENYFIRKDGSSFPVSIVASPLMEKDQIIGCVAAFQDITERKQTDAELKRLNELLERQATTDLLTGISNRLKFNDRLDMELCRSKRFGTPLSLIMFDIDNFKSINDSNGHDTGDRVLREIAGLVSRNLRLHDLIARWGGDEFIIIVANTGEEGAVQLAEKLRELIEKYSFPDVGSVQCSFGVTDYIKDETSGQIMQKVDLALYQAKSRGRNRVEVN
jgi:diguanylate cyclase (GGDEF)-like protein/PAS domain S-box-containing protein